MTHPKHKTAARHVDPQDWPKVSPVQMTHSNTIAEAAECFTAASYRSGTPHLYELDTGQALLLFHYRGGETPPDLAQGYGYQVWQNRKVVSGQYGFRSIRHMLQGLRESWPETHGITIDIIRAERDAADAIAARLPKGVRVVTGCRKGWRIVDDRQPRTKESKGRYATRTLALMEAGKRYLPKSAKPKAQQTQQLVLV